MKEEVRKSVFAAVIKAGFEFTESQIVLEHPEDMNHGDFSTNVAMVLKGGKKLADQIAGFISIDEVIAKVEVAGPGFINIWLQNELVVREIDRVITQGNQYGKSLALISKRVMVEFTDPNPFKEFHIGHLYSNIVGESLSRLIESQGAELWRVCYQGDVGIHVAKAIWGMWELSEEMPGEDSDLPAKAKFMGKAYSLGATAYEENTDAKIKIDELNKKIYLGDPEVLGSYETGRRWSLEYFDTVYDRLGTTFKRFYFESEAGKAGLEYVNANLENDIFEKSQGAIVFRGEKYGLHTRVFVNSAGLPTYEAKELGLAPTKYKDFAYDRSIIVTGNEIDEYFKVLLRVLGLINPDLASKTRHVSHGMVRLPEGKMSSRTGKIVTGMWLLDEAVSKAREISPESTDLELIGQAAVKYALLKSGLGKDIEFNFDESVSFEGNSGPYLQYTYARTRSVLAKSQFPIFNFQLNLNSQFSKYQINDQERSILRYLYRFPEVVSEAATRLSPSLVCTFLYNLAQRFNTFYNRHSILTPESGRAGERESIRSFRLTLTAAVGQVIKNGLYLLGIEAPERM